MVTCPGVKSPTVVNNSFTVTPGTMTSRNCGTSEPENSISLPRSLFPGISGLETEELIVDYWFEPLVYFLLGFVFFLSLFVCLFLSLLVCLLACLFGLFGLVCLYFVFALLRLLLFCLDSWFPLFVPNMQGMSETCAKCGLAKAGKKGPKKTRGIAREEEKKEENKNLKKTSSCVQN